MPDEQTLLSELTPLLEALPRDHLVGFSRQAALNAFPMLCKQALGGQPLEAVITSLFADFSPPRVAEVAHEIALCAVRNSCWNDLLSLPGEWRVKIRCPNREATQALRHRKGPVILVFWHLGATRMIALGIQSLRIPALLISRVAPGPWFRRTVSQEMKMVVTHNDPRRSVIALKQALDCLRKGEVVAVAVDGSQGQKDVAVPYLGRQITVSRGAAVLARLTGAPIIPCVVTWGQKDWSMDFRIFEPLPQPAATAANFDQEVLTVAVRRFEEITRAFPGQCRLDQLAYVAGAPRT